jgi:hypothetical protein
MEVRYYPAVNRKRIFVVMEDKGAEYIGCLLCDDDFFCAQVAKLLQSSCGESIRAAGSSDISVVLNEES